MRGTRGGTAYCQTNVPFFDPSPNRGYICVRSQKLMYTHEYTRTMCLLLLLAIES